MDGRARVIKAAQARPVMPAAEVRRWFRHEARRLHPDVGGDPAAFRQLCDTRDQLLAAADTHPSPVTLGPRRR